MPKPIEISEDGFLNLLRGLNKGAVVDELDRELIKGVGAILDHGGTSTITLKISVKRLKDLNSAVTISHDVAAKHPKEERPAKAMFVTHSNGLVDQQQDQGRLPLGEGKDQDRPSLTPSARTVSRLDRKGA